MTIKIYIGVDSQGEIRHIEDVKSGLECGCVCIMCKGPLIARKGHINAWHFAHEGGQTHINCEIGARNYIRHVACEILIDHFEQIPKPERGRRLSMGFRDLTRSEPEAIGSVELLKALQIDKLGPSTVVAAGRTKRSKSAFVVYVAVGQDPLPSLPHEPRMVLLVEVPALGPAELVSRDKTISGLRRSMRLRWMREEQEPEDYPAPPPARLNDDLLAHPLNKSWLQPPVNPHDMARPHVSRSMPLPVARAVPRIEQQTSEILDRGTEPPSWVSWLKPQASMFCYRFTDGSFWLLGQIDPAMQHWAPSAKWLLRQWPYPEDGWDEALAPSFGTPNIKFEGYVSADPLLLQHLSTMIARLSNTYDPCEVYGQFFKLGWRE